MPLTSSTNTVNTVDRFMAAAEVATRLIEEGYTEVSVDVQTNNPSTIIYNTVLGGGSTDMLKEKSPSPVVFVTVKATKRF